MNPISALIGGGVTSAVSAVGNVLDALFTSDEERLDKKAVLLRLAQKPQLAQSEVNKIEAAHRSIFVAGWRPFIGWTCGFALLYNFVFRDIAAWVITNLPVKEGAEALAMPPALQMEELTAILFGLLGLGAYRTVEKLAGRAK